MIDHLSGFVDANDFTRLLVAMDSVAVPPTLQGILTEGGRRAYYLLQAGRHEEASRELIQLLGIADTERRRVPPAYRRDMQDLLALAGLWGTFEDACLRSSDACLFPLDPAQYPPEVAPRLDAAAALLLARLRGDPNDVVAEWLLNLAHMALGDYPGGVPAEWRIAPDELLPQADFPRFANRAPELGVDVPGHAGGVVWDDFDGDEDFDLLVSSRALRDSIRYFENRDGTFVDRTREAGLLGLTGGLNLLQGDYDNDGDLDVYALRGAWTPDGQPSSLLRNEGGGRFADVTEEAGVFSVHPGQTAAWGDYDNDGWLDLVVGNEAEVRSDPPRHHPTQLFRNNRDGTFTDVAEAAGLAFDGFTKTLSWGDYDNDGRLDLFVSAFEEDNALYHNEGPGADGVWRFADVTDRAGIQAPYGSLPAWWFDFDNDGWLDIFVASYRVNNVQQILGYRDLPEGADTPHLYINRGDGTFEDATSRVGLDRVIFAMGSNFGDLDNDGWLDFYLGTGDPDLHTIVPNVMLRNVGGRRLEDVSVAGGFSHMSKGHAVAFTDVDNDGDQDIYVVLGGAVEGDVGRNVLWENPGNANRWITLRLEGVEANRSAIGGRIRVRVDTPRGARDVFALVGSGGSFGGSSLQQEIGLGDATAIRGIEVRWPGSNRVETFHDVALDGIYQLREGSGELEPLRRPVVRLGAATGTP